MSHYNDEIDTGVAPRRSPYATPFIPSDRPEMISTEMADGFWDSMVPEDGDESDLVTADEHHMLLVETSVSLQKAEPVETVHPVEGHHGDALRLPAVVVNVEEQIANRRAKRERDAQRPTAETTETPAIVETVEPQPQTEPEATMSKSDTLAALQAEFTAKSEAFTAAVSAKSFQLAEKIDAVKAEIEVEQAEQQAIEDGRRAHKQLGYQARRIPELEVIVTEKDPEIDKAEIEKINSVIAMWIANTPELEKAVAKMEQILKARQPVIVETPKPAKKQEKTFKCFCCGKEITAYDTKVEPFWVVEREFNTSLDADMTPEQVYQGRTWCLECIHDSEKGPKGGKIFPILLSMKKLANWANGRGERARKAEERREERRRNRGGSGGSYEPKQYRTIDGRRISI